MSSKPNALPLSDTLRDLALIRASNVDLSALLDAKPGSGDGGEVQATVEQSYQFVKEARAALKIQNRGEVETQGARVEEMRSKFEDVLEGLAGKP